MVPGAVSSVYGILFLFYRCHPGLGVNVRVEWKLRPHSVWDSSCGSGDLILVGCMLGLCSDHCTFSQTFGLLLNLSVQEWFEFYRSKVNLKDSFPPTIICCSSACLF